MKKTIHICLLLLFTLFLAVLSTHAEENKQVNDSKLDSQIDSQKLYMTKFCSTCHGQKGISIAPNYPNLANQNQYYLINQVNDIINKKRTTKLTVLMTEHPIINSINDKEIAQIAAYMTNIK